MSLINNTFKHCLRLMDTVNQERIKRNVKILWPDYEILNQLNKLFQTNSQENELQLQNFFIYSSFEQNYCLLRTNVNQYLSLKQIYEDKFTHVAIWVINDQSKQGSTNSRHNEAPYLSENSRSFQNRINKSLQKTQQITSIKNKCQQIYVVLTKRSIAIDQIVKNSHKVCISVVPLSQNKFLWGGSLNYQEFQTQKVKKEEGLFKNTDQNFGFNLKSRTTIANSTNRKTMGAIDKRHLRFSNFLNTKNQANSNKPVNPSINSIKIFPQHIRQHLQFLYIQIDLTNNPYLQQNQFNFNEINIYGRHKKPIYGKKYQEQSEQSSQSQIDQYQDDQKTIKMKQMKKFIKQEIFSLYSMPFITFNSYLQSQLNYGQNEDMREINYRGSCRLFSAMKNLQIKTNEQNQKRKEKQSENKKQGKLSNQKYKYQSKYQVEEVYKIREQRNLNQNSHNNSQRVFESQFVEILEQNEYEINLKRKNYNETENNKKPLSQTKQQFPTFKSLNNITQLLVTNLCQKIKSNQSNQNDLIYIPIFNPHGQPLRLSVKTSLIEAINPQILKSTRKVQILEKQIHEFNYCKSQGQVEIDSLFNNKKGKRQTIFISNTNKKHKINQNQLLQSKPLQQIRPMHGQTILINVFLTRTVYKRQTVELLIKILELFQTKMLLNIGNPAFISQINSLICKNITQLPEVKYIMKLLDDLCEKKYSMLKSIVILALIDKIQTLSVEKHEIIDTTKKMIKALIENDQKSQHSQTSNQNKEANNIIDLIKKYHQLNKDSDNQFLIQFWFQILFQPIFNQDQFQNEHESRGFVFQTIKMLQTITNRNNLTFSIKQMFQRIFNDFFLLNCKQILTRYSHRLQSFFKLVQEEIKQVQSERNCKEYQQNNEVEIDGCTVNDNKNKNLLLNPQKLEFLQDLTRTLLLLQDSTKFSIGNLLNLPIKIFLSSPLKQFLDNEFEIQQKNSQIKNPHESSPNKHHKILEASQNRINKNSAKFKLQKFIKRYFIGQNSSFLEIEQSKNSMDDGSNSYLTTSIDLLQIYIKINNLVTKINTITNQVNKQLLAERQSRFYISNIIDFIKYEYLSKKNKNCQINQINGHILKKSFALFHKNANMYKNKSLQDPQNSHNLNKNNLKKQIIIPLKENNVSLNKVNSQFKSDNHHLIQSKSNSLEANSSQNMQNYDLIISQNDQSIKNNKNCLLANLFQQPNQRQNKSTNLPFYLKLQQSFNHYFTQNYNIDILRDTFKLNQNYGVRFNHCNRQLHFSCFKINAKIQLQLNIEEFQLQKRQKIQQPFIKPQNKLKIIYQGKDVFILENFNYSKKLNVNIINLIPTSFLLRNQILQAQQIQRITSKLTKQSIFKINVTIQSSPLPLLQNSLTFINLRLSKYLKKKHHQKHKGLNLKQKQKTRKTIGKRFTEHFNRRKSVSQLEKNMFFIKEFSSNLKNGQNMLTNKETSQPANIFNLPQKILFMLLKCDRNYIQQEQKFLQFIDQFYEINDPQYNDFVLYLCLRPNFLKLSTVLKHYQANKAKYLQSPILQGLIKNKLRNFKSQGNSINYSNLFVQKARLSTIKPLKNAKDTAQQLQLVQAYMKQCSRSNSLERGKVKISPTKLNSSIFGNIKIPQKPSQNNKITPNTSKQIQI